MAIMDYSYCDWAPIHENPDFAAKCANCPHSRAEHECERPSGRRINCMQRGCHCAQYVEKEVVKHG